VCTGEPARATVPVRARVVGGDDVDRRHDSTSSTATVADGLDAADMVADTVASTGIGYDHGVVLAEPSIARYCKHHGIDPEGVRLAG
jgi:hypothetical protein